MNVINKVAVVLVLTPLRGILLPWHEAEPYGAITAAGEGTCIESGPHVDQRRDDIMRKMLASPPKPHADMRLAKRVKR